MKYLKLFTLSFIAILAIGCNNNQTSELRLISKAALINQVINHEIIDYNQVVFMDEAGQVLTKEQYFDMPNAETLTEDKYVDVDGAVKKIVVRKKTAKDVEFLKEVEEGLALAKG